MTVVFGLIIPSAKALRRPNRIRLSTCSVLVLHQPQDRRVGTYIRLPLMLCNTPGFGIPEWITSSVQVDLAGSLLIPGD
jgi:hypothetical protein